ncbi:MAG: hypothetical protein M3Y50_01810 [Acidobacteriota bacterium]|nr:hypothetical protein [Acidobacteriota bacterium]
MLPNDDKPWAKPLARTVIFITLIGLGILAYYLEDVNSLHIPEMVGIFLLFLTIVPPNLAVLYPWILPPRHDGASGPARKSTVR